MAIQQETTVKVYRSSKDYQTDAQHMAQQGWTVSNVTENRPRSGCIRVFLLLGIFALVFPPKPEIVVTYSRAK